MPQTLNDIADRLAASGLLSVGEIATLLSGLSAERSESPEQFVQTLTARGALTEYQADSILSGRIEHLVLGNYVVLDKLGQGGMGLVLKARHRRMDRIVALKVLSPDTVRTPTMAERFQREVRAAAKLSHPNIVTAFDADEHHGTHFLVMEYVEGRDLASIVKKHGPFSIPMAVNCILQAATGLEYAHQQGVVHRDIKPGNLILAVGRGLRGEGKDKDAAVRPSALVKILDMGLARIDNSPGTAADRELTTTGSVLGTIDYMSPEQALDTKQADARSDIYSLGCSLFYLLTGHTPYCGDTVMRRQLAHRDTPIPSLVDALSCTDPATSPTHPPPSNLDAQGSRELDFLAFGLLDAVFQKMIAKKPDDRFQSMTEVIQAFVALRDGLSLPAVEELFSRLPDGSASASAESSTSRLHEAPAETVLLSTERMTRVTIVGSGSSWKGWIVGSFWIALLLIGAVMWLGRGDTPSKREAESVPQMPVEMPSPEPLPKPEEVLVDHDRRVAEWALRGHGYVQIDGQSHLYFAVADLPKQNFKTTNIWVDANSGLNDDRLKDMLGLDSLRRLALNDNHCVTDAGVAHLKVLPSLEDLTICDTRMTNDGLKHLTELNRLEFLVLMGRQFTDEGVGHLAGCSHLRSLQLRLPQMTDKGLQRLQGLLPQLAILGITNSQVTDAGLAHLAGLQHLEQDSYIRRLQVRAIPGPKVRKASASFESHFQQGWSYRHQLASVSCREIQYLG